MKRALLLLPVLGVVWMLWSGYFQALLLSLGALSCAGVALLSFRLGITDREGVPLELVPRALLYLPWLLLEIVKANLDVTRRILAPRVDVSPTLFRARATQATDLGRAIYANSITLTPGTVSYEIEEEDILVHAIGREVRDALLEGEMDRRVRRLEGEG